MAGYGRGYGRPIQPNFINPEYYDGPGYGAFGYEPQKTEAIDSSEDPLSKRRKLESMTICVDYIRGFCPKGAGCMKAHVNYVESIDEREILAKTKFCHDFQNRGMCARPTCKFLHVTRREEDEFLLTGTIPQSVFDRARRKGEQGMSNSFSSSEPPPRRGRGGGGGRMGRGGGGMGHAPQRSDYYTSYEHGGESSDYYRYDSGSGSRGWEDDVHTPPFRARRDSEKDTHPFSQPVTYGNYCIDFLKGNCNKGRNCHLDHVGVIEDMDDRDAIVKNVFCHDFQNKRCPRSHCKYLHATFDEQRVFVEHGYLPNSVCVRNKGKLFFSDICIDNLRSQCIRGNSCQYQHVEVVFNREERIYLSRSIFCHDYQENMCPRSSCKLLHTGKGDESYFIENGCLPEHLKKTGKEGNNVYDPAIEAIADTVCRDFIKGVCNRGASCKFYHPRSDEVERLLTYQKNRRTQGVGGANSVQQPKNSSDELEKLKQENDELKQRVQQLERLLADACHCITLAVGDQNPTIKTLMETIAGMAPESALANTSMEGVKQE